MEYFPNYEKLVIELMQWGFIAMLWFKVWGPNKRDHF